jgi:nicotinamidase-related amidase
LANVVSPLAHSATWNSDTALLILDFQVVIGDQRYAKSAAQRAAAALKAGRAGGLPVVFSKVKFRAGYRDIAGSNKAFALIKMKNSSSQVSSLDTDGPGAFMDVRSKLPEIGSHDSRRTRRPRNHLYV